MSAGASRWASSRSTNRCGTSAAALAISSWVAAVCSERRSANGLRASSVMRLLAERMPTTSPSASSTGRWFTPEAIIAMLASGASTSAPIVWTGVVMMVDTGASRETPESTTLSRKSTSVTMPRPSRSRTSRALRPASDSILAASRMGVSGSQNSGALRTSEVTGRLRTSGRERMVRAAWISRSRWLPASHIRPSGWLSRSKATSLGMQYSDRVADAPAW